jgi:hypothetical protein
MQLLSISNRRRVLLAAHDLISRRGCAFGLVSLSINGEVNHLYGLAKQLLVNVIDDVRGVT